MFTLRLLSRALWVMAVLTSAFAQDAEPEAPESGAPAITWHDVEKWGVEGRAWAELPRQNWFDRLPREAESTVTKQVWALGQDSAGLLYLPGDDLIGHDSEATVDGSHPNALGIVREADAFEPVLRAALKR